MPRRRFFTIVFVTAIVFVCGLIAYIAVGRKTPEASFQGHSASYWLHQIVRSRIVSSPVLLSGFVGSTSFWGPGPAQSMEAFNTMGTNGEPVFVGAVIARENALAKTFRRIYPRFPAWLRKVLPEPCDPLELRSAALLVLRGPASIRTAPKLLPWLKESDSALRLAILSVVLRPDAGQIPFLLLAADDPNARVRSEVLGHLTRIGPSAATAVPAILKRCADGDPGVRHDAAWALWKITGQTNTAVPVLESVLGQTQDAGSRERAAYHLLLMGDSAPALVTSLINSLNSSRAGDRANACALLRDMGPPAAAAIPALRKALQDPEPEVRRRAEVALSRTEPAQAATNSP